MTTKKRIGWLYDRSPFVGGAEISMQVFRQAAPDWAEIVPCPLGRVAEDVDAYAIGNCASYDKRVIPLLEKRPAVKILFDIWKAGDKELRAWLCEHAARLIFVSPMLQDYINFPVLAPIDKVPCPVDVARFRAAVNGVERHNAIWIGRMWPGKGLEEALDWAQKNKLQLDCYGYGPDAAKIGEAYKGDVELDEVPGLLAKYRTFVFLPEEPDPCPRTVIEAWAAGCELVLNGNVGTAWWIQNDPAALETATDKFWNIVKAVL